MKIIIPLHVFSINVDELSKLTDEGFGVYVDKNRMEKDKVFEQKKCFSAFIKNDVRNIDTAIFCTVGDTDCDLHTYETNYDKPMDLVMKKVTVKYHTHPDYLVISLESEPSNSKLYLFLRIPYKYSIDISIIICGMLCLSLLLRYFLMSYSEFNKVAQATSN